jgi:TRAP-type C4-dicarboxylate transport system substrate-binding protein
MNSIALKRVVVAMTFALAASVAAPASSVAQEVKLRAHHFLGPVSPQHKDFLVPWANKIAKDSGGRLKIEVYPSMTLGGAPPQLFDQVKDGVVDIAWTLIGYTPGRFPRTEVFELPFVHGNALSTTLALQDFYQRNLQDEFKDVHVLLLHSHDGNLFHSKKPIRSMANLKAMTIRTPSTAGTLLLEALGGAAAPVQGRRRRGDDPLRDRARAQGPRGRQVPRRRDRAAHEYFRVHAGDEQELVQQAVGRP